MTMRINKFLSRAGVASRRNSEKLVLDGLIKVNGQVMTNLSYQVEDRDKVEYNGQVLKTVEKKYYLLLNKPIDYACTNSKEFDDKVIFDLIDIDTKLFSIGRLDKDSRGMILITNDGDIYNKVIHPRNEVYKKYIVQLDKYFIEKDIAKLENGVDIGDYITDKARVKKLADRRVQIEIKEGKNRQVRRMFAVLGYTVVDLNRVSIGQIEMGKLEIGTYRNLTEKELAYLRNL